MTQRDPSVEVSAPGKTILMGEHAAVYGHPALVATIDRRLTVRLEPAEQGGLHLDLPQVEVDEHHPWDVFLTYAQRAASAWQQYQASPSPRAFRNVRGEDPAHLVKVAVGETLNFLHSEGQTLEGRGLRLRLHSAIPVGAGFGSSAAASAAVVSALLHWHGREVGFEEMHRLTLEVERRQHGSPSGIDNATVLHGGLVWAERNAAGQLHSQPLAVEVPWLRRVRIYNSGRPGQSTGDVVAAVRRLREQDRRRFDAAMESMETATRELHQEMLHRVSGEPQRETQKVVELIRRFQRGLESLGVVPEEIQTLVRQVEAAGGAAKISGAGALEGPGAGSLLVFHGEPEVMESWRFLDPLEPLRTTLGAPGVHRVRATGNDRI